MASPWDDYARLSSESPLDQLARLYSIGIPQIGATQTPYTLDPSASAAVSSSPRAAPGFLAWLQSGAGASGNPSTRAGLAMAGAPVPSSPLSPSQWSYPSAASRSTISGLFGIGIGAGAFTSPTPNSSYFLGAPDDSTGSMPISPTDNQVSTAFPPANPTNFSKLNEYDAGAGSSFDPVDADPPSGRPTAQQRGAYDYASLDPFASVELSTPEPQLETGTIQPATSDGLDGSITRVAAQSYPRDLRPTNGFFSYLFGGPDTLTSPAGNVVGYYDHQAANAGLDILGKYAAVAPFVLPGGFLEVFSETGGSRVAGAISDGIEEALQGHHALPKFMGGPTKQDLVMLRESLHKSFHRDLAAELGDAGFPPVGGRGGGAKDWLNYFNDNQGSYDTAVQILRRVSRNFDRANGTTISLRLDRILSEGVRGGPGGAGR